MSLKTVSQTNETLNKTCNLSHQTGQLSGIGVKMINFYIGRLLIPYVTMDSNTTAAGSLLVSNSARLLKNPGS